MKLKNKTALVVGGASGIGAAIARMFAQEGAAVLVADKNKENGQMLVESLERARFLAVDVASADSVDRLFASVSALNSKVDIVVNSAGLDGEQADTGSSQLSNWKLVMSTNLDGVYYVTRAALPVLEATGEGVILNIASVCGLKGQRNLSAYASSKAGVVHLTKSVALEYAARGVRVNALCPSIVQTPLLDHYLAVNPNQQVTRESLETFNPMPGLIPVEQVAKAALFLCSADAAYITGVALPLDGGYTA